MSEQNVAIIGAGLAGSALAHFLTQSGRKVVLIDQHEGPSMGASALPVGMLSPHHTAQATPMSALSQAGVPMIKAWLEQIDPLRKGWMETQVSHWPEKRLPSTPARVDSALALPALTLVNSWLHAAEQTGHITYAWSQRVARLERHQSQWRLINDQNQAIGEFPVVALCSAFGANAWMEERGYDLRPVAGQMTLGPAPTDKPLEHAGKCKGVYLPWFKGANPYSSGFAADQPVWTAGSTYRRGDSTAAVLMSDHIANRAAVERTYSHHLNHFDGCQENGLLHAWTAVRCASVDRMPLVGPLSDQPQEQGLFSLVALGSRGLSVAGICAQALSEWITTGDVKCLPSDLVRELDPRRFAHRQQRKRGRNSALKTSQLI